MVADLKYFDGNLARIDRIRLICVASMPRVRSRPVWVVEAGAAAEVDRPVQFITSTWAGFRRKLDESYKLAWHGA